MTTATSQHKLKTHNETRKGLSIGLTEALKAIFGSRFTTNKAVCLQHGTDESAYVPVPPDAVVFPESTEEVKWRLSWPLAANGGLQQLLSVLARQSRATCWPSMVASVSTYRE